MSRRRRRLPSSAKPAPALDEDDILSEILLRLPPLPSSLPRASLVCRRWRRLVADPHFLRRFRGHHRKPPLLGFFDQWTWTRPSFTSMLDSPDSIPAARFSLRLDSIYSRISDCRHGRVLFLDTTLDYFLVWDPITDDGGLNFLYLSSFSAQVWKWKANCDGGAGWMLGSNFNLKNLLSLKSGVGTNPPKILGMVEDDNTMLISTDVGEFMLHLESMQFKKLPMRVSHKDVIHYPFTSFYSTGHIAKGAHPLSTLNATGSTKRTISSVVRSERAASGVGRNSKNQIRKRAGPSMVEEHRSLFGVQSTGQIQLNIEGDASENFIPRMFESEVPTSIEEVQGACSERSRSKILAVKGNSSSSTMRPTQGVKKNNSTVVRKQQPEPTQEFSIANCIHAMREMVDFSDEEKVLSCDLFRDAANREIFLSLDGILRTMWLKRQLTKNRGG